MSDEKGYNGWKNYETWVVALWIGNDQGSYSYWQEETERAYREAEAGNYSSKVEEAASVLSSMLEDYLQEFNPLSSKEASMYSDLLSASLSEVDTYEIATNWIEDIKDQVDQDLEAEEAWDRQNIFEKE